MQVNAQQSSLAAPILYQPVSIQFGYGGWEKGVQINLNTANKQVGIPVAR